ncbi:hypothetical protein HUZ36_18630 [Pseudoalteromonas sp. McH1-7]|uniref:hypothetical protein n=1 Tax=Pseudoalteromonas sp. McH1-7 TaxID=2745574 RepID=UPI0015923248|nr:hypothetical protein [Pseudoalteromonas sp. McH1-7]NUZ12799.1 hypothetical protein [Pseudoalteromonas sp. McH1-7]
MFASFLVPLLAFLATVLSIRGETWNSAESGIRKVTGVGWLAFGVAAIALLTGIWTAKEQYRKEMYGKYIAYYDFIDPLLNLENLMQAGDFSEDTLQSSGFIQYCREVSELYKHWNTRVPGEVMTTIGSLGRCEIFEEPMDDVGYVVTLSWVNDQLCQIMQAAEVSGKCDKRVNAD